MSDTPSPEVLHARWIDAFNSHDLDAHVALYTEDAVLFGSVDELQDGRPAIRAYFAGRSPGMRVKRYPMPLVRALGTNAVMTAGHVDFANGDTLFPYRITWALVRHRGNWRIAQHHGSPRRGAPHSSS